MAVGDPGDLDIAQMNRNYLKWMEGADDDGEEDVYKRQQLLWPREVNCFCSAMEQAV